MRMPPIAPLVLVMKIFDKRNELCYNYLVNSLQHRTVKEARDALVDVFGLDRVVKKATPVEELAAHVNLDTAQYWEVCDLAERMWRLMVDDPYPPQCAECAEPLPTPAVPRLMGGTLRPGRPRQYCSDACRQAAYRARRSG